MNQTHSAHALYLLDNIGRGEARGMANATVLQSDRRRWLLPGGE